MSPAQDQRSGVPRRPVGDQDGKDGKDGKDESSKEPSSFQITEPAAQSEEEGEQRQGDDAASGGS